MAGDAYNSIGKAVDHRLNRASPHSSLMPTTGHRIFHHSVCNVISTTESALLPPRPPFIVTDSWPGRLSPKSPCTWRLTYTSLIPAGSTLVWCSNLSNGTVSVCREDLWCSLPDMTKVVRLITPLLAIGWELNLNPPPMVRGSWFMVRGSWFVVRDSWCIIRGSLSVQHHKLVLVMSV